MKKRREMTAQSANRRRKLAKAAIIWQQPEMMKKSNGENVSSRWWSVLGYAQQKICSLTACSLPVAIVITASWQLIMLSQLASMAASYYGMCLTARLRAARGMALALASRSSAISSLKISARHGSWPRNGMAAAHVGARQSVAYIENGIFGYVWRINNGISSIMVAFGWLRSYGVGSCCVCGSVSIGSSGWKREIMSMSAIGSYRRLKMAVACVAMKVIMSANIGQREIN